MMKTWFRNGNAVEKFLRLFVFVGLVLGMVACTKAREPKFPSGQGEGLLSIADYDGKTFEITPQGRLEDRKHNLTQAQRLNIKSKSLGEESFSILSYGVSDPLGRRLLGDLPILGRPNAKYMGQIRVEENHLKVYKIAESQDIPVQEQTFALKMEDGRLAVPLIGYPLSGKYTIDKVRNDQGEVTTTLFEKREDSIANATHFRVDFSRGQVFDAVVKTDLFPASFFDGEWFYTETIVAAPHELATNIGLTGAYDQTMTPSDRVKFLPKRDGLVVVNMNIDERLLKDQEVNLKRTMTIPGDWKAFKVSNLGTGLQEVEDNDLHWENRPYIQLKLGESKSLGNSAESQLVSLEVEDDYFSFTVEQKGTSTRYKYAFLRVKPSQYQAKRLFKEDKKTFGFFETRRSMINNYETYRQEDLEKNTFISRFNPRKGKIVFHFTKTTPEWFRPYVKDAVLAWDEAFQKAAGMRVVLDESMDVELGDIRYNSINVIESVTGANLYGYGPSITDPFTGEIISATSNLHLTSIRESLIDEIRNYVQMELGLLEKSKLPSVAGHLRALESTEVKSVNGRMEVTSAILDLPAGTEIYLPADSGNELSQVKKVQISKKKNGHLQHCDVGLSSGNIHADIRNSCPEVTQYIESIRSKNVTHSNDEVQVLDSCSRKLVVVKAIGTLTHEMGHNFGLRHNFMASNDEANFWPKDVTKTEKVVRSSSVMEYPSFNEDRLVVPGPYDIAALRYGYGDVVEADDGRLVQLDAAQTITKNLKAKGVKIRQFKFCTDEDVAWNVDPMCQRHDAGTTPLEVVRNLISEYEASYQLLNFRRDSARSVSTSALALYRYSRFMVPMAKFYEEWRMGLSRYLGKDERYLERLTSDGLKRVVEEMRQDPRFSEFTKLYEPAANEASQFLLSVALMENHYCVVQRPAFGSIELVEFEKLREQAFFLGNKVVKSCGDDESYFKENGLQLLAEVGHPLNSYRFDLSPDAVTEPLDVIGTYADRLNAFATLTSRFPKSYQAYSQQFRPSILDEPDKAKMLRDVVLSRIIAGVNGANLVRRFPPGTLDPDLEAQIAKSSFKNFMAEKDLVMEMLNSVIQGTWVSDRRELSLSRLETMIGFGTRSLSQDILNNAVSLAVLSGGIYFVVDNPKATDAIAVAKVYNGLMQLKRNSLFDLKENDNKEFYDALVKGLPAQADVQSYTVGDFKNLLDQVAKAADELELKRPGSLNFALNDLMTGKNILDRIIKSNAGSQSESQEVHLTAEQLSLPIVKVFAQAGRQFSLTKESIAERVKLHNGSVQLYQLHRSELDAQIDILSRTLLTFANI